MARIEKRKKSKAEVQGSYFILKVIRFSRLEMSNSGPNLQEYRKKGLLEKDISFLSLSPPFFFLFVSHADAGENTREIETWDCSKNKKIRAKPDSRIQCVWRFRVMGS